MMSKGNQLKVEELLEYGFSPGAIHKHTGLSLQQIYQLQEQMYERKAKQKEIQKALQNKKDVK